MTEGSADLVAARYAGMRWNAPQSIEHADLLLRRLAARTDESVLDLGCGWGELLVRLVTQSGCSGTGVDSDESLLARGRVRAALAGADVRFVHGEAAQWQTSADIVLCVGAAHALSGTEQALDSLAALVAPGGRLLFGDACWDRPPDQATATMFEGVLSLATIVDRAVTVGWRVLHLSTADQREWDDFESTWRAGRQQWLLDNPEDPQAPEVLATVDRQLHDYVSGYRGTLGFCYLLLAR